MPDQSQERSEILARVRRGLAATAALSDQADALLDASTDVVRDSQLQEHRALLEEIEREYVDVARGLAGDC